MTTIKRYGTYRDGKILRFGNKVKKGLPVTIKEVGGNVRNNAKRLVRVKTGRLQRSIRVMTVSVNSVFVGTSVPYAEPQEFGTVNMSAGPYIRPSVEITAKLVGRKISTRLVNAWRAS